MAREITLLLLSKGASVFGVDLREAGLEETAGLAGDRAAGFAFQALDITDRAAVEALPAAVKARFGQIDGVLNVAGIIQPFVPVGDLTIEQIERVFDVNFWGTVYVAKAFLPELLSRPEALLLDFSSMGGLVPVPGQGAYGASKGAVKLFTETLYAELHETNVHVVEVFPGAVATNITGNSGVEAPKMSEAEMQQAMQHITTAPQAAQIVVDAIEANEFRVLVGEDAKQLDQLSRADPTNAITTIARQMAAMAGDD